MGQRGHDGYTDATRACPSYRCPPHHHPTPPPLLLLSLTEGAFVHIPVLHLLSLRLQTSLSLFSSNINVDKNDFAINDLHKPYDTRPNE